MSKFWTITKGLLTQCKEQLLCLNDTKMEIHVYFLPKVSPV